MQSFTLAKLADVIDSELAAIKPKHIEEAARLAVEDNISFTLDPNIYVALEGSLIGILEDAAYIAYDVRKY